MVEPSYLRFGVAVVLSAVVNRKALPFAKSIFRLSLNLPAVTVTLSVKSPARSSPANVPTLVSELLTTLEPRVVALKTETLLILYSVLLAIFTC